MGLQINNKTGWKNIGCWIDRLVNAGMSKTVIYLAIVIMLFFSCKKNDNPVIPPPVTQFNKLYGGSAADFANSITKTHDGGYVFTGVTNSNDGDVKGGNHGGVVNHDMWVVKLDKEGRIIWEKALGGSQDELANCIISTSDGGFVVAGVSQSNDGNVSGNHGENDVWIVRLNSDGDIVWQKTLGGSGGEAASAIISTSDAGYLVVGSAQSYDGDVTGLHGLADAWVMKLDKDGNLLWEKALGGTNTEYFNAVTETSDGYVMAGITLSNDGDVSGLQGRDDAWVVKLAKDGDLIWQKTLGGTGDEVANSIVTTPDNLLIMAGSTASTANDVSGYHGGGDAWVVKIDQDGNILWQKAVGGSMVDNANAIITTSEGGYLMAGLTESNDGDVTVSPGGRHSVDAWILKLDKDGNTEWQKIPGGSDIDIAFSIITSTYGGYVMAGLTVSNDRDVSGNHGDVDAWVITLKD